MATQMKPGVSSELIEKLLNNPRQFGDPRLHGNGFIQLDLAKDLWLHVWASWLPRQQVSVEIHDHRYDFWSIVILGTLVNTVYDTKTGDGYQIYKAMQREEGEDTELVPADIHGEPATVDIAIRHSDVIRAGNHYTFKALDFHETNHQGLTATIMRKTQVHVNIPLVLCPVDKTPDKEFNRHNHDTEQLWKTIELVVDRLQVRTSTGRW